MASRTPETVRAGGLLLYRPGGRGAKDAAC